MPRARSEKPPKGAPVCPNGQFCKFGAEYLFQGRYVCRILNDTRFGRKGCPFFKPREKEL